MTLRDIPNLWSARFGLARVPLFGEGDAPGGVDHAVLLDGGYGTFALSISEDELWREAETASWVWSGNIPHHVTVTEENVTVLRWDRRWCRKVGGKSENWRKLLIVKHSERRCAAAERSLRHGTSYSIGVPHSIFR